VLNAIQGKSLTGNASDLITDMCADPTLVFLKQFRDASCPTKACYQAIVEARLAVDPVGASFESLDPSLFELSFADWASHPIASELGVSSATPLHPTRAFCARFGFDLQLGLEVWRAPT
jgi:hypothetical protein